MQLAWITDPHLDFLTPLEVWDFLASVQAKVPDAVVITGDICAAKDLQSILAQFQATLPVWFVLGNHDAYGGSIRGSRETASAFSGYLPKAGVTPLTRETALIGVDGWADGREGDFMNSPVWLNDYLQIDEFRGLEKGAVLQRLHQLGDEAVTSLQDPLRDALDRFPHVMLATHVPPFRGACWHEGETSDDNWAPHFVCQSLGTLLEEAMAARPDRTLTVLCGHTHSPGMYRPLPNLTVLTGGAEYGRPGVLGVFDIVAGGGAPKWVEGLGAGRP